MSWSSYRVWAGLHRGNIDGEGAGANSIPYIFLVYSEHLLFPIYPVDGLGTYDSPCPPPPHERQRERNLSAQSHARVCGFLPIPPQPATMRRGALLLLLLFTAFLLFSIHMVWNLLGLLVFDGSADVIARTELPQPPDADADADANAEASPRLPHGAMIPKILHQTGKNATIPPVWQDAQHSCVALHSPARGWEYRYWTDAASLAFIRDEYPWFLPTFQGYAHPIQRADAIRYFALAHYGGVYLDLDDGCARPLDPLLAYPAWLRKTHPTGISNDAMGAVAGHPFFTRVLRELPRYDRNWGLPYVTVMGSTGPLFLSVLWRRYSGEGRNVGDGRDGGRIRILFPDEYQGQPWSFFTHHLGNSWHTVDVDFIFWARASPPYQPNPARTNLLTLSPRRWLATGSSSRSPASPLASASSPSCGLSTPASPAAPPPSPRSPPPPPPVPTCLAGNSTPSAAAFPSGNARARERNTSSSAGTRSSDRAASSSGGIPFHCRVRVRLEPGCLHSGSWGRFDPGGSGGKRSPCRLWVTRGTTVLIAVHIVLYLCAGPERGLVRYDTLSHYYPPRVIESSPLRY